MHYEQLLNYYRLPGGTTSWPSFPRRPLKGLPTSLYRSKLFPRLVKGEQWKYVVRIFPTTIWEDSSVLLYCRRVGSLFSLLIDRMLMLPSQYFLYTLYFFPSEKFILDHFQQCPYPMPSVSKFLPS